MASVSENKGDKRSSLSITECPICFEKFKNPKCLPCIHTFCLACLEKCGKDKEVTESLACPLCRNVFAIPEGNFKKLPNNFFIEHLLEMQAFGSSTDKEILCQLCEDDNDDDDDDDDDDEGEENAESKPKKCPPAKKYCIECGQNLCGSCSGRHRKIASCRTHKVIPLEDKHGSMIKSKASFCDLHEDELRLYCYDCKKPICMMCKALEHDRHPCTHIKEAAQKFSKELQDHYPSFDRCVATDETSGLMLTRRNF